MWSIPRKFSESSTRSRVAANLCWPGLSSRSRSIRRSTPAGFSFAILGRIFICPVFIALVISVSESAIPVFGYDD